MNNQAYFGYNLKQLIIKTNTNSLAYLKPNNLNG